MKRFDIIFLVLAAVSLVLGVGMGVAMAATLDFTLMPVHAHLNLLGWASLALFGLVYRAYPQLAERRIAKLHLALCGPAAFLLPVGIAVAILTEVPGLAIGGALLWFAGCITFLVQMLGLAFGVQTAAQPAE